MIRRFYLILILILVGCSLSHAQEIRNRFGIGVYSSAISLIGGTTTENPVDISTGLSIFYGLSNRWLASLNGSYSRISPELPLQSQFNKYSLYPISLDFSYTPRHWERVHHYFTVGAGVVTWDANDASSNLKFWPKILLGVGLEGFISSRLSAAFYLHYNQVLKKPENIGEEIIKEITDNRILFEMGFSLKFWSPYKGDIDNDGIPNHLDNCLNEPEDYDGYFDLDGCPDPDNDNDGILDVDDYCPNIPEDIDGFEDLDGCPDLDNDGDNIPDVLDSCMNLAEDFDGFRDLDGCPDFDNDLDGIIDIKDKCPNRPETFNGYLDDDGCPDKIVEEILKGKKVVLSNINFEYDSSILISEAFAILNEVLAALRRNHEIELIIRGYTDSKGDFGYNLELSQRRAQAVVQYLLNQGIDRNRLKSVGYGATSPIADNSTEEGRLKNRRVEFVPRTKE